MLFQTGKMTKNKRAVSIMIGYILLVAIAVIMSVIVYAWLKSYVPKDTPDCPEGVSLLLSDVKCVKEGSNVELSFKLKNNGRFNVDGYLIHATDSSDQELATVNLSGYHDKLFGGVRIGEAIRFLGNGSLLPGRAKLHRFFMENPSFEQLYKIEIKPFRFEEIDGKNRFSVCGKARIFEDLNCAGGEVTGGVFDPTKIEELVSWWKFEDSFEDSVGSNGGTNNGAQIVTGKDGKGAFLKDSEGDYIEIANSGSLEDIQEDSHSISLFYKPLTIPTNTDLQGLFVKEGHDTGLFYNFSQKKFISHQWVGDNLNTDKRSIVSSQTFNPGGEFYQVIFVYDKPGRTARLYLDGSNVGEMVFNEGHSIRNYGTNVWRIGTSDSTKEFADGVIDEVMIFNKALDGYEIVQLFGYY